MEVLFTYECKFRRNEQYRVFDLRCRGYGEVSSYPFI